MNPGVCIRTAARSAQASSHTHLQHPCCFPAGPSSPPPTRSQVAATSDSTHLLCARHSSKCTSCFTAFSAHSHRCCYCVHLTVRETEVQGITGCIGCQRGERPSSGLTYAKWTGRFVGITGWKALGNTILAQESPPQ